MAPDVFDKQKRSEIMSMVKSDNNQSTELTLIQFFKDHHICGWRRNYKIKGKPDFTFPKKKIIIFTDGCFWHGHDCRNTRPKNNETYWTNKISRNMMRDEETTKYLEKCGWYVIRIWECELKKKNMHLLRGKLAVLIGN